jgi:hypothetical protein
MQKAQQTMKPLEAAEYKLAQFVNKAWCIDLRTHRCVDNTPATVNNIFNPSCWVKMVGIMEVGDTVRVMKGAECDFDVSVVWIGAGGIGMRLLPHQPSFVQGAFERAQCEQLAMQTAMNQRELGGALQ